MVSPSLGLFVFGLPFADSGFSAVAIIFVVTTIRDAVRTLPDDRAEQSDPAKLLASHLRRPRARAHPTVTRRTCQRRCGDGGFAGHPRRALHRGTLRLFLAFGIVAVPDDVAVLWSSEEACPVGELRAELLSE